MHRFYLFLFISLVAFSGALAQQSINQTDTDGKKHGLWTAKYKNGKIKHKTMFEHGIPKGLSVRFDKKGKKTSELILSDQGQIARGTLYHESGKIMASGKYTNTKKDSTWNFYSLSGILIKIENYKNGVVEGEVKNFYKNGKLKSNATFVNGVLEGPAKEFFENGNMRSSKIIKKGKPDGPFKLYYDNKVYRIIGKYAMGKKDGKWRYYSPRLKVEKEEIYEKGNLIYSSEEILTYWDDSTKVVRTREKYYNKAGRSAFIAYHPNGKVSREGYYFKNKKDSSWTYFDEQGAKESIRTFYRGKKNGHWSYFYADGGVWKELSWFQNKLDGEFKEFYETGELKIQGAYQNGLQKGTWTSYDKNGTVLKQESLNEN